MENKKILPIIAIGVILILAIIIGGVIWFTGRQPVQAPTQVNSGQDLKVCTMEAKQCADGSYVSRTGPKCEFAECPTSKTDETAGWQTYRNEEFGFEFKYPAGWSSGKSETGVLFFQPEIRDAALPGIWIYIHDNYSNLSLEEWWLTQTQKKKYSATFTTESYKVDNANGLKVQTNEDLGEKRIILKNDSKIIEFLVIFLDDNKFNQILSTFKFIDSTDETADWQTYRNEKYGFEFQYPTTWNLSSDIINNPSNLGFRSVVTNSGDNKEIIEISATEKYPNLPDFDSNAPISLNEIGSQKTQEQVFSGGYCDMLSCSPPFVGIWTKKGSYTYTFNFNNTIVINGTYQKILSTFKFVN